MFRQNITHSGRVNRAPRVRGWGRVCHWDGTCNAYIDALLHKLWPALYFWARYRSIQNIINIFYSALLDAPWIIIVFLWIQPGSEVKQIAYRKECTFRTIRHQCNQYRSRCFWYRLPSTRYRPSLGFCRKSDGNFDCWKVTVAVLNRIFTSFKSRYFAKQLIEERESIWGQYAHFQKNSVPCPYIN